MANSVTEVVLTQINQILFILKKKEKRQGVPVQAGEDIGAHHHPPASPAS